jgi:AcrR family transcriptional regulator
VSRAAGIDKALLYRYYNNLENLIKLFCEQKDLWWTVEEILGTEPLSAPAPSAGALCALLLKRQIEALRRRPVTLAILSCPLCERNRLYRFIEELREQRMRALMRRVSRLVEPSQQAALLAVHGVLAAAALQFAVRGASGSPGWLGVDFSREAGWARLDRVLAMLCERALAGSQALITNPIHTK